MKIRDETRDEIRFERDLEQVYLAGKTLYRRMTCLYMNKTYIAWIQTKQNKTKQNKTKQNKTKQNKTKQNKTKQNKTKQNKTKLNKTKLNKTKETNIV